MLCMWCLFSVQRHLLISIPKRKHPLLFAWLTFKLVPSEDTYSGFPFHPLTAIAAAHKSGQSNHARKQHRHSIAGVLPIQRTQSDNLPSPASDNKDQSQLALRKVMSDGPVKPEGGEQKGMVKKSNLNQMPSGQDCFFIADYENDLFSCPSLSNLTIQCC